MKGVPMQRLFTNEKADDAAQAVIERDVEIRLEMLFKKYKYIEPMDLLALVVKMLYKQCNQKR